MPIKFIKSSKRFIIETERSVYAIELYKNRYLINLHYGEKKGRFSFEGKQRIAFGAYEEKYKVCPDALPLEASFFGSGNYRDCALKLTGKDGTGVTDFRYKSFRIFEGRRDIDGLPFARPDEDSETLEILMTDKLLGCDLYLYYTVFPKTDVISRHMVVVNRGKSAVRIDRCMPLELCLDRDDLDMISLWGRHCHECNYQRVPTHHGVQSVGSRRGASSPQYNPFIALCAHGTSETRGDAYGFNFVYSGSFLDEVEVDQLSRTTLHIGLNPADFSFTLDVGESFESPEVIMTYSGKGLGQMTRNLHAFTKNNILPIEAQKPHPVVLNSWEACYFDISEEKLLSMAEKAAELGMDTLVVDDGWFGARRDDRAGLGDWFASPEVLPRGLAAFAEDVRAKGVKFGIWIEPEMVNPDSDLFRAHPDWALRAPDRDPLLSREQLVLDMSRDDVIEYLIQSFETTFAGASPDYFKWDMNRHMCGVGSAAIPPERQGEVSFRYMKGVYRLLSWLREKFPNAIIETCSSGGGRYDLGMMSYGVQIWTSDNTDPYGRMLIQSGAITAYPATTMSCHVSNPKENLRSLDFRYKVAIQGMLGYELNILETSDEVNKNISEQIKGYRQIEHIIREGNFFRLSYPEKEKYSAYYYATEDRGEILLSIVERSDCRAGSTKLLKVREAIDGAVYTDAFSKKRYTGRELREGLYLPLMGEGDTARLYLLTKND